MSRSDTQSKTLLFIPTYNCGPQIGRVLDSLDDDILSHFNAILIVDNGSTDHTIEKAIEGMKRLGSHDSVLIQNTSNYGLGGSIKTALAYASRNDYDYVVTLHGDDQADIRDAMPVLATLSSREADLIVGARFHPYSRRLGYSRTRALGNRVLNTLTSWVFSRPIYDLGAGLNIFRIDFLKSGFYEALPSDLTFDVHLLFTSLARGGRVDFFPISWREEDQQSNARVLRQGLRILLLLGRYLLRTVRPVPSTCDVALRRSHTVLYETAPCR